ncbi:MAG TPA: hypothetical protein VJQ77_11625 [Novosphingobium sp.]|nr:hypothetical protein [Novosphingobium sp.]
MTPRLNLFLLGLVLILGVPFYWFQLAADRGGATAKPLTIGQLRDLADAVPGRKPTQVDYEEIGWRYDIGNKLAAGIGLRPIRAAVRAYELTIPGEGRVTIDRGTTPAAARQYHLHDFDRRAQRRIDEARAQAVLSLLLADHPLHNGNAGFSMPDAQLLPDMSDGKPRAVAPGIVLIPLPGLTVGSNMVYARLEDGREYLFTGDAAMIERSWRDVLPPARIVTSYLRPQERQEIVSWLMTINALSREAPHMTVIAGHEPGMLAAVHRGFSD